MKAVLQRVRSAKVEVDSCEISAIGEGLMILWGVEKGDGDYDVNWLVDKISTLRIFSDENGKMNLSIMDIGGEILLVSQFTLMADCQHGRRPGFTNAGDPNIADAYYNKAGDLLSQKGIPVKKGIFGADMLVTIENDGPVTIILESPREEKQVL